MIDDPWHAATLEWDGRRSKLEKALTEVFKDVPVGDKVVVDCGGRTSDVTFIRSVYYRAKSLGMADIRLEGLIIREEDQSVLAQMKAYLVPGPITFETQGAAGPLATVQEKREILSLLKKGKYALPFDQGRFAIISLIGTEDWQDYAALVLQMIEIDTMLNIEEKLDAVLERLPLPESPGDLPSRS